jgi:hypothetical protein
MGNCNEKRIRDKFTTYSQLEHALKTNGLESSQLIVGIDFTKSNTWNGGHPFYQEQNLHSLEPYPNPYHQVLSIMCNTLQKFDDDGYIDAYGFGDTRTTNQTVFPLVQGQQIQQQSMNYMEMPHQQTHQPQFDGDIPCLHLQGVLQNYNSIIGQIANGSIVMSGPTNFAPLINKAIEIVERRRSYHILLIICDGQVDNEKDSIEAIVNASRCPLSIICVGVGKGNFDMMEKFDDRIKGRKFDNFQFVNFHKMLRQCENNEVEFARNCMMEIPEQYRYIKKHYL